MNSPGLCQDDYHGFYSHRDNGMNPRSCHKPTRLRAAPTFPFGQAPISEAQSPIVQPVVYRSAARSVTEGRRRNTVKVAKEGLFGPLVWASRLTRTRSQADNPLRYEAAASSPRIQRPELTHSSIFHTSTRDLGPVRAQGNRKAAEDYGHADLNPLASLASSTVIELSEIQSV